MTGIFGALVGSYFSPVVHTYSSGSGNETIPVGCKQVIMEATAGGGAGSASSPLQGGGGAGDCKTTLPLTAADWNLTIAYVVGAGGPITSAHGGTTTISSGSKTIATMTALGGDPGNPLGDGLGGLASGGLDSNTTGNTGTVSAGGTSAAGGTIGRGGDASSPSGNVGFFGQAKFSYI